MSYLLTNQEYDAIVIGAGHNGLVAAAYLAKAGLKTAVIERRDVLGGAAATEELFPGFRVNTGAVDAGLFLPRIAAELKLEEHGLRWLQGPALAFAPTAGGDGLTLWRGVEKSQAEIARFSKRDAGQYPAYLRRLGRFTAALRPMLTLPPLTIPRLHGDELASWLPAALKVRGLGRQEMMELLRVLPMPAADFVDEWFESPALKAMLGAAGVSGGLFGPKAPGTAFMLLYQALGAADGEFRAVRFAQGGMGRLAEALAGAAKRFRAEIYTGAGAAGIQIEAGRASGVILDDGRVLLARAILSSATPQHTFFDLVGAPNLPVSVVREVKNIRTRGGLARVNLALRGLPVLRSPGLRSGEGTADPLSGHILICPDLEYLERASDDAKYGQPSQRPYLDIVIPSLLDSSLAPPGHHLMCINVQYAPYFLREGDWDTLREPLGDRVLACLEEYFPGLGEKVLARQVLTPIDLERQFGLTGGDIYQGEMGLDQLLFMRPIPGYAGYRTPVDNLYLCGAGAHPGGGVTGAPGYNASRAVIKDLRR